jgi:hypothetical protein
MKGPRDTSHLGLVRSVQMPVEMTRKMRCKMFHEPGRDKATALKKKGVSNSGSSAKMMISEMAQQTKRDTELKRKERAEWMAIKRKEVEVNEYKSKQQDLGYVCLVFLLTPVKLKCMSRYMLSVCRRINSCLFCVLNKVSELKKLLLYHFI